MGILDANVFGGAGVATNPNQGKTVIHSLPKNPADKSTIVSILPREVEEGPKPGVFPGTWKIPACQANEDFVLFVVEPSSYFIKHMMENMPPTEVQINSAQLANSIIEDYLQSTWLAQRGLRGPGLFWISGHWNKKDILTYVDAITGKTFQQMLSEARERQRLWMLEMVNEADTFWARSNGNPRSIPEYSFMAAHYLQVKGKPWMENITAASLSPCRACGEMINTNYPVCKYCHAIVDDKKAKELDLHFADN